MELMTGLGLAGLLACIGMFLRAKIKFLREMFVPATILAGLLGCIFLNLIGTQVDIGVDAAFYTDLVGHLFILSFISIGLTKTKKQDNTDNQHGALKHMASGSMSMCLVWCIVYGLSALIGIGIIAVIGSPFGMDPIYGMLIPYGFCEGPGLAVSFGTTFEQFGWQDASAVGLTFAAVGFLSSFIVGVPLAKLGIKKGIATHTGQVDDSISKGFYNAEEQQESLGSVTTYSGSIETLTFHFGLMAISYVTAIWITKLVTLIPGSLGITLSGLTFMYGLISAYIIKFIMEKCHIEHLHNSVLQTKITGLMSDFLVICAFMAVQFSIVSRWAIPLAIECILIVIFTLIICIFFGQRLGSSYDFERTLGLLGTCLGTAPSGIALVRIVDPRLSTPTVVELGIMTVPEILYISLAGIFMFSFGAGSTSIGMLIIWVVGSSAVMLVMMKLLGALSKKTYSFNRDKEEDKFLIDSKKSN